MDAHPAHKEAPKAVNVALLSDILQPVHGASFLWGFLLIRPNMLNMSKSASEG